MKNILCAQYEPNEATLTHIYEFARAHHWQIERCGLTIPAGWSGDGVISDYHEIQELQKIKNFNSTPIVSKLQPPAKNIRTVMPDTSQIAQMVAQYLLDKGFERFATTAPTMFDSYIHDKPRDIIKALENELAEHGIILHKCLWSTITGYGNCENYENRLRMLHDFFNKIPKPFAVFLPNATFLPIVYRALSDSGLNVPSDVAVLSNVDDWLVTNNAIVDTSYVGGEYKELGTKLAETLYRMMNGEIVPQEPIYVTSSCIVSRRSTNILAVSDSRLAVAVDFFMHHYMEMISVDDAARLCGLSRKMLTRLFKKQFDKTPGKFLFYLRMNQIKHLLDTTEISLEEIAEMTGYGSDMALSLAFKRENGITPGAYRAMRKN